MVLVDTSILIDYLKYSNNKNNSRLDEIIEKNIDFGISKYTYQELLQGAKTEKEFQILQDFLSSLKFYDLKYGLNSYKNAAYLNFQCRKAGFTIRSTIDLLIAEIAIENDLYLLHNDKDFTHISKIITDLKIY